LALNLLERWLLGVGCGVAGILVSVQLWQMLASSRSLNLSLSLTPFVNQMIADFSRLVAQVEPFIASPDDATFVDETADETAIAPVLPDAASSEDAGSRLPGEVAVTSPDSTTTNTTPARPPSSNTRSTPVSAPQRVMRRQTLPLPARKQRIPFL
jgi:hypothetical protein